MEEKGRGELEGKDCEECRKGVLFDPLLLLPRADDRLSANENLHMHHVVLLFLALVTVVFTKSNVGT